ncbi:hypothetical protein [Aquimarina brevivitae]|uniref:WG repeat protein n=1 Tax=Aquimarina brevivitae TaxID=323412 RepID=A0A4Q7NYB6_9FLAO|nr:hypothetical protein [Aquimarina brevivitae]RZS92264.1 hypothetical protein EV197_2900 [Aquimarina brevivitae]
MEFRQLIKIVVLGLLLIAKTALLAQEKKQYQGYFQIGDYIGLANYEYILANKDTLFDGQFEFQRTNPKALLEKQDISFSIEGQFSRKYPDGYWSFRFNEFKTNRKSSFKDNTYVLNVDGEQFVAFGTFTNGKLDGEWTVKNQRIENSEVENVSFNSVIKFNEGFPQQSFRIEAKELALVGRCLRNGLAHDKWTLYSDNTLGDIESWYFNEGELQLIERLKGRAIKRAAPQSAEGATTETITLSEKYFKIIKLQLPLEDVEISAASGITALLAKNEKYYQRVDTVLSLLSPANFESRFKVKVSYYPSTAMEDKLKDSLVLYYQRSKKISDFLLSDTQLAIRKLSDKKVASLVNDLERIDERILAPLGQISDYAEENLLNYISNEHLIPRFWKKGKDEFRSYDNYGIELSVDSASAQSLLILKDLAKQTFERLDEIRIVLERSIDNQEKQAEAIALEEEMILQLDKMTELTRQAQTDTIPEHYYKALVTLRQDVEDRLSEYANTDDMDQKLALGRKLVDCFTQLETVGKMVLQLPAQQQEIAEKYTDAVWNPFTATVMDELVKRRIVSAYENVLVPYFIDKISKGLNCNEASKWIQLIDKTHLRMLAMREEDTRKMERRIRKEEDPLVILQRFDIPKLLNQK